MQLKYEWPHFESFWASWADKLTPSTRSYMETHYMRPLREGWRPDSNPFENFKLLRADVMAKIPKTVPVRTVGGGMLRTPALIAGDPRHFMRNRTMADMPDTRKGKTHIKLCVNVDACAGVGPELFYLRGAAMLALAEALEACGKRVEIRVAIATTPFRQYGAPADQCQRYFVGVKPFNSPVSPLLHSFALMSPKILQGLFFTFWKTALPYEEQRHFYQGTNGAPGRITDHGADLYVEQFDAYNSGNYTTIEGAKEWIVEQMKALGADITVGQ